MKKLLLFITVLIFLYSCSSDYNQIKSVTIPNEYSKKIEINYQVIEKEKYNLSDSPYRSNSFVAKVIISLPDSLIESNVFKNGLVEVCLLENLIAAKFYKSKECIQKGSDNSIFDENLSSDCYIGFINGARFGYNWRYCINPRLVVINSLLGTPEKINVEYIK